MSATGAVAVMLDKPRSLRYGGRALRAIEQETGKNLLKGEIGGDLTFSDLCVFVWAGLLHESPDLSIEDAADLVDLNRLDAISAAMNEAITLAFPAAGDKKPGKAPKARR